MSKENTISARLAPDDATAQVLSGQVLPGGVTRPLPDWARIDEEEVHAAAEPAVPPIAPGEIAKAPQAPRVKTLRRALGLTQEEFAARYRIPLGTLRDWEQGRTEPDQPARAYINVIASDPDWVSRALARGPDERRTIFKPERGR
jgi:putative transcriptional regulator